PPAPPFHVALADVGDHEAAARREREPPRIAQPVRVDLRPRTRAASERVRGRHAVGGGTAAPRIDGDDLAEDRAEVLPVAAPPVQVPATAAVAEPRVQEPVRTE